MTTVLQYLVIAAVIGLVLFGIALLLFGRGEQMSALPARTSPARLPDSGITGKDVRTVRFALAVRGYRMSDVDWTLDRLADELDRTRERLAVLEGPEAGDDSTAHTDDVESLRLFDDEISDADFDVEDIPRRRISPDPESEDVSETDSEATGLELESDAQPVPVDESELVPNPEPGLIPVADADVLPPAIEVDSAPAIEVDSAPAIEVDSAPATEVDSAPATEVDSAPATDDGVADPIARDRAKPVE